MILHLVSNLLVMSFSRSSSLSRRIRMNASCRFVTAGRNCPGDSRTLRWYPTHLTGTIQTKFPILREQSRLFFVLVPQSLLVQSGHNRPGSAVLVDLRTCILLLGFSHFLLKSVLLTMKSTQCFISQHLPT